MKMFIGVFKDTEGKINNNIYYNWDLWFKDTFSPLTRVVGILEFKVQGENYMKRKENLEDIAKEWQMQFAGYSWSYGELAEIGNFFYKNGKRYGLLKEFRENGIC